MAYLVYVILCLIWGSTWLAIKFGLEDSPPFWSAGFRFAIALTILLFINFLRRIKYPKSADLWLKIGLSGVFIFAIPYMLVYQSEVHIDSSLAAVLFASFPFFVALISIFMLKEEKLSLIGWLALAVGFAGVLLIFYDSLQTSRFQFIGALMVVLSALSGAFATVYVRKHLRDVGVLILITVQMIVGAVLILATAALFEPIARFEVTTKSIAALFYLAVLGTIVTFSGYFWLLKKMKAIAVSLIAFIEPLLAIVLGRLIRGESFSTVIVYGSVLILLGVVVIVRSKPVD